MRVVIQEAPAVLGARRSQETDEAYRTPLLMASMKALKRDGEFVCEDIDLLGRRVGAMICKVGLMPPDADDQTTLKARCHDIIVALLERFRLGAMKRTGVDKSG